MYSSKIRESSNKNIYVEEAFTAFLEIMMWKTLTKMRKLQYLFEYYDAIIMDVKELKMEKYFRNNEYNNYEEILYKNMEVNNKDYKKSVKKYGWVFDKWTDRTKNKYEYSVARILAINLYEKLEKDYKKGKNIEKEIIKILRFKDVNTLIDYIEVNHKSFEEKFKNLYKNALKFLDKEIDLITK